MEKKYSSHRKAGVLSGKYISQGKVGELGVRYFRSEENQGTEWKIPQVKEKSVN